MFDPLYTTYTKIISCLGIVGYLEEDIKKRGLNTTRNLPLNCLYAYPNKESTGFNSIVYQMMFPDNNHNIPCPKFFTISLTNQQAAHSYIYCLKFSEKYSLLNDKEEEVEIYIPIVIFIKSQKQDLESFKELLNLINYIIINEDYEKDGYLNAKNINDYKKVQLMNLFYFLFSLPHTSPHSLVKLKLNKEIKTSPFESIDFYFSSNCEIPCNKNDTDINILFLILDQSIIIKVLFALLTEKQIILMASQAYLLHLIIPAFLKLLFPFKWLHSCITVLPKENIDLLEAPGAYIIGILSIDITSQDIMDEYPNRIVVDCDTNEIFGDSHFEPFQPPQNISAVAQFDEKDKKKSLKKGKDKDIINKGNYLTQGNNLLMIEGSTLYQYENDINIKKTKLNFEEKNNIIIDTKNSQMLVDKSNTFINRKEWKWLRRHLQLVRNPEIFDLENIDVKKNLRKFSLSEEEEDDKNIILPNRPFSYNIQNILMNFLLKKIDNEESDFMSVFTKTNLYLTYNSPNQYQNNAGKKIIENISDISDSKMQERTIDNCFNIEYTLQKFQTQHIIHRIDEKLTKNKNLSEKEQNIYKTIKIILSNYNKIKMEEDPENINNYDGMYDSERNESKSSIGIKDFGEGRKTEMKKTFGRLTKKFTSHERNKTSVLQESFSGDNKFILAGVDNSVKGVFKFYKEDGFLEFINFFDDFLKEENINIKEELYLKKINAQILDILLNDDIFFKKKNSNSIIQKNNTLKRKDTCSEKEKKKKKQIYTIPEYDKEEEDNEMNQDERGTVIQGSFEDYDFATNFMKNINIINLNFEDINDNNEEEIISFPNLNSGKEEINENNNIIGTNEDNVNLKLQYYLFIAMILEDILADKEKSEILIEEIYKRNNIKIDITFLLLKIYRLSYKYSGLNHRDFPYFSYYTFLSYFDLEKLKSIKEELNDIAIDEIELYVIFGNVFMEKEKVLLRKNKKKKTDEKIDDSKEKNIIVKKRKSRVSQLTNYIMDKIHSFDKKKKESSIDKLDKKKIDSNEKSENTNEIKIYERKNVIIDNEIDLKYLSSSTTINDTEEFNCKNENSDWNIIIKICEEISNYLPVKKRNYKVSMKNLLQEIHCSLMKNKDLFNLIGQLKYIYPEKISSLKGRMCFWLNCINYLIVFTLFYKEWYLNKEKQWILFFQNIKYNIGGNCYTFNDMIYIIYQKVLFFQNTYKANENLTKFIVNKVGDAKIIEEKNELLYNPFLIYIPIKGFIKPIIFNEDQLEKQSDQRIRDYFTNIIKYDPYHDYSIFLTELLMDYYTNFMYSDYVKFRDYIDSAKYNFIKDSKFKSVSTRKFEWILNFDSLFEI